MFLMSQIYVFSWHFGYVWVILSLDVFKILMICDIAAHATVE